MISQIALQSRNSFLPMFCRALSSLPSVKECTEALNFTNEMEKKKRAEEEFCDQEPIGTPPKLDRNGVGIFYVMKFS